MGRHPECHVTAVPPKLSIFTFRRDLALGERVYEACTVIGGDKPVQVTWTKDGVPVKSIEGVQVRNLDQLTTFLVIDHLSPRHAGNYTCTATNDASSVQHTSALNVNGKFLVFLNTDWFTFLFLSRFSHVLSLAGVLLLVFPPGPPVPPACSSPYNHSF